MMTTNLFVIANVKQLRTDGSFRILLHFFRTSWGVGVLNSAIFNSFHNRVEFRTILEDLRNFGGGGGWNPQTPPRYATGAEVRVWKETLVKSIKIWLQHSLEEPDKNHDTPYSQEMKREKPQWRYVILSYCWIAWRPAAGLKHLERGGIMNLLR